MKKLRVYCSDCKYYTSYILYDLCTCPKNIVTQIRKNYREIEEVERRIFKPALRNLFGRCSWYNV
jgi:ribosomal protein L44E